MKVLMTENSKQSITLAELPKAKALQKEMLEYTDIEADCKRIAHVVCDNMGYTIFDIKAELAHNMKIWDRYSEGSHYLDIWIECWAVGFETCLKLGFYLTSAWEIDGTDETNQKVLNNIYYEKYVRERKEC